MLARVAIRPATREPWQGWFSAFVAGTFLFGWLLGLASVLKLWHLSHAPRWMILSGVGYVTLMLPPALTGFALRVVRGPTGGARLGRASLALAGAGVTGLVAGLLVL